MLLDWNVEARDCSKARNGRAEHGEHGEHIPGNICPFNLLVVFGKEDPGRTRPLNNPSCVEKPLHPTSGLGRTRLKIVTRCDTVQDEVKSSGEIMR